MTKFFIVALFCAPGWLFGGVVRYHAPARHPTPTARAMSTPLPTMTPVPTTTPLLTATASPTETAVLTATALPSNDPVLYLLGLINSARAQHGYQPLTLSAQQSPRSQRHAQNMEASGSIWHQNAAYPADSFPATIFCYPFCGAAENVGEASGAEAVAIQDDLVQMLTGPGETWTPGCVGNHACTILSPTYHQIGIGITQASGTTYIVEDFVG